MQNKIADFDAIDILILAFNIPVKDPENPEFEEVEKWLWEEKELSFEGAHELINRLAPMIQVGTSELTGKSTRYKGFGIINNKNGHQFIEMKGKVPYGNVIMLDEDGQYYDCEGEFVTKS